MQKIRQGDYFQTSFYFLQKFHMRWKQGICSLVSIYSIAINLPYIKNKLSKTLEYWSRDMLNFNFSEKGLRLVSPQHLVYDFSRKMFLMVHSIYWPKFVVQLPLLLKILGNTCITIVCQPSCDVIKFEINLIFLIKLFCYLTEKSRQKKLNILRAKRAFEVK